MNHIVRDYFLEHNDFYNYTYDELEGLGHEWKFWDIELQKFLDYAGLPVVK
jgi:enterochelin esterase-like enzyme